VRAFLRKWLDAFDKHELLTYATAIAMRALIAFVSLTFLGIALLGATGHESIWARHIGPAIEPKLTHATFTAINTAVQKVFASDSKWLIAFAAFYAVWQMSGSIRAVMNALNRIVEAEDDRPFWHRFALSVVLAVVVIVLLACALLAVQVSGHLLSASNGFWHWLFALLRWPVGAIFLGLAVGVVARYAPVKQRGVRWASVGATLIVVAWLVESAVYAWFVRDIANYKSASGNLLLLIVVTTYLYISSIVFLVGAQLDEFLRQSAGGEHNLTVTELIRRSKLVALSSVLRD
jgi:membrane protein